ncbi:MAG TPA: aminoglycoside phosphotransferase family protein, partial [Acidobacteriota bacterium]|nr:aminoglycoside phosphotransferase family protein [Acidobacteriota bacterium]
MNDHLQLRIQQYLIDLFKTDMKVTSIEEIGKKDAQNFKAFGYGKPYKITYLRDGIAESIVLESMAENTFGHDHFSDRAQILLWQHSTSSELPRHVRSLDVGAFTKNNQIISLGDAEEFFVIYEFVTGSEYACDLQRIADTGTSNPQDEDKVSFLAKYLAEIHSRKKDSPQLYRRRIRELLGHGECIMGLIDNYPDNDPIAEDDLLQSIEEQCLKWRWRLRNYENRLCQVHGDFHPWNILFRQNIDFTMLDRSRGEWGEPADDIASMLINYLFLSLQKCGSLNGPFQILFETFWNTYMEATGDTEMTQVISPFLAWRGLVIANPIWYP